MFARRYDANLVCCTTEPCDLYTFYQARTRDACCQHERSNERAMLQLFTEVACCFFALHWLKRHFKQFAEFATSCRSANTTYESFQSDESLTNIQRTKMCVRTWSDSLACRFAMQACKASHVSDRADKGQVAVQVVQESSEAAGYAHVPGAGQTCQGGEE
eukprot:751697-Hanusia_phi.AAC.5